MPVLETSKIVAVARLSGLDACDLPESDLDSLRIPLTWQCDTRLEWVLRFLLLRNPSAAMAGLACSRGPGKLKDSALAGS